MLGVDYPPPEGPITADVFYSRYHMLCNNVAQTVECTIYLAIFNTMLW